MSRTDEDTAMRHYAEDKRRAALYRTCDELRAKGWRFMGLDSTGRRAIMKRDGETCRVDEDGQARR